MYISKEPGSLARFEAYPLHNTHRRDPQHPVSPSEKEEDHG